MSIILTATNNVAGVSRGLYEPNFTLSVKELDTRNMTIHLESAQFELHFNNVSDSTNKLYIATGGREDQLSITTGTYTDVEGLIAVINAVLTKEGHDDVVFSYSRHSSRVTVSTPTGKRCVLKSDSPDVVLGVGELPPGKKYEASGIHTFPHAVDITKGRRVVLLYTDLIGPSIEYQDNTDSRVLKTFLIQTLNGVNNYIFSKEDKRLMLPHDSVREMTFWLKFNTGELITEGYPIYLDLRLQNISPLQ